MPEVGSLPQLPTPGQNLDSRGFWHHRTTSLFVVMVSLVKVLNKD